MSLDLQEIWSVARKNGAALAERYRLNLKQPKSAGAGGNWLGVGIGSSADFQDHRAYSPGDDPRYINWQAYARSGEYSMKLYRDEVSPAVDVVFDESASISGDCEKLQTALTLLYFCMESVLMQGGSLNCHVVSPRECKVVTFEELQGLGWLSGEGESSKSLVPKFGAIPWKSQSARLLISDLLYPGVPDSLLHNFAMNSPWRAILRVFSEEESQPKWAGGMKLFDSETGQNEVLYCDRKFMESYKTNYESHFSLWMNYSRRIGAVYSRFASNSPLDEQFSQVGLKSGLVAV